jgi:hypothetical protein
MNAQTGEVYELDELQDAVDYRPPAVGEQFAAEHLPAPAAGELHDLARMRAALERAEAVVAVSEKAAQRALLGERELNRRARRRR